MTELWTPPSDELLLADAIAKAKIENPHDTQGLEAVGISLPEPDDDEALEASAAIALAEIDDSDPSDEPVAIDDDAAVEDLDDVPVGVDL